LPAYVGPAFIIGLAVVLATWRAGTPTATQAVLNDSPLQLRAALQMTALFQLVLFIIAAVQARWSSEALVATSAFVGLTDLDALTLSLARTAASPPDIPSATVALVAGILSNTLLKLGVAAIVGRGSFRAVTAASLGAMAVLMAATLMFY
jgi:uncharacterized membrane protein (DUF4010 family)